LLLSFVEEFPSDMILCNFALGFDLGRLLVLMWQSLSSQYILGTR